MTMITGSPALGMTRTDDTPIIEADARARLVLLRVGVRDRRPALIAGATHPSLTVEDRDSEVSAIRSLVASQAEMDSDMSDEALNRWGELDDDITSRMCHVILGDDDWRQSPALESLGALYASTAEANIVEGDGDPAEPISDEALKAVLGSLRNAIEEMQAAAAKADGRQLKALFIDPEAPDLHNIKVWTEVAAYELDPPTCSRCKRGGYDTDFIGWDAILAQGAGAVCDECVAKA